jgi:hypothetical protein
LLIEWHHQGIEYQWSCSIAGPKHAQVLIFLEWDAIKTMVLPKAYVELYSELRGEKQVSPKPPLTKPTIAWSREIITQGHIERWI